MSSYLWLILMVLVVGLVSDVVMLSVWDFVVRLFSGADDEGPSDDED